MTKINENANVAQGADVAGKVSVRDAKDVARKAAGLGEMNVRVGRISITSSRNTGDAGIPVMLDVELQVPAGIKVKQSKDFSELKLVHRVDDKTTIDLGEKGLNLDGLTNPNGNFEFTRNKFHYLAPIVKRETRGLTKEEEETMTVELDGNVYYGVVTINEEDYDFDIDSDLEIEEIEREDGSSSMTLIEKKNPKTAAKRLEDYDFLYLEDEDIYVSIPDTIIGVFAESENFHNATDVVAEEVSAEMIPELVAFFDGLGIQVPSSDSVTRWTRFVVLF
jgi:hypothetical protein